ncbi:NEL-type E3 ubiquitin ligase domain-containing protein [Pseudomonas sp. SWRI154]|uniref:NEL-type E3 ubiquitin ligase domain-containing protein n=1 Tax=Pseudomonas sp. SWRI154 TaxID=2745501 RepID=UPI001647B804|nr:NEL-type E3 ubiquitin ligase domain-containing protein [Pseudomonas sp. SWRI154]MBC3362928.1 hypothetical protein [Pseudomonas sp. SWRI154]
MPETIVVSTEKTSSSETHGVHYDLLKNRISPCYIAASVQRQVALSKHSLQIPGWYLKATHQTRAGLKRSHEQYCKVLNQVDKTLGNVQDIRDFAEPLLRVAIQQTFRRTLDVRKVYFARKFALKTRTDVGSNLLHRLTEQAFDTYQYRGSSLLEAALANFEPEEEHKLDCDDCHYITTTPVSADGTLSHTLQSVRAGALPIAPEAFIKLCRKLDLGRQYQAHIKAILQPNDGPARSQLDQQLREHHRQLLAVSTEIAWSRADIRQDTYQMLQQVIGDQSGIKLDGRAVTVASLKVLDVELVGPLLIGPERERSNRVERLVAYLPDDPEHPVKEYTSSAEFMVELRRRLHGVEYRRFFSRFVPVREQGGFFERFNHLYRPSPQADLHADFVPKADLRSLPMEASLLRDPLWEALRRRQIAKILADARATAVPTGEEDKKARMARLDSWENTLLDMLNMAAFVVPGLGPVMMTVWAVQMLDEAFEGIESFEQGETKEMWAHFSSLALNVAFAAAGAKVLPRIVPSETVNQLEPVTRANGESRLWRPDLASYKSELEPPVSSTPDGLGLHRVNGRQILPLGGTNYEVQRDRATDRYRIRHPSRPDAYQPELTHNGSGAWSHELERPQGWEGTPLMRRLGHGVKDFSDAQLEQIRVASDTTEEMLRRLHVEGEPLPVALADTIKRFDISRQVDNFVTQISSEDPLLHEQANPMIQLHLLTSYGPWPKGLKLKVVDPSGKLLWEHAADPDGAAPLRDVFVTDAKIYTSSFPRNLIEAVDAAGNDLLAGTTPAIAKTNMPARVRQFRKNLAEVAVREKTQLFNDHYAKDDVSSDPRVTLIKSRFPSVPATAIGQMMNHASDVETQQMARWDFADAFQTKPIPLRIAEELRHFQRKVRLNRAYEGVFLETLATPDTPRLVLATLKTLSGWSDTVRIELRDGSTSGELIDSIGPQESTQVKTLVKRDNLYKAYDDAGNDLSTWDNLYVALQRALPDAERRSMGRPSIHQGGLLKEAVGAAPLGREALAKALKMPAVKPLFQSPMRLASGRLGYPMSGLRERLGLARSPESRVLELYPNYRQSQVRALLESLGDGAVAELKRRKVELNMLRRDLDRWVTSTTLRDIGNDRSLQVPIEIKRVVADRIRQCWRRQGRTVFTRDGRSVGYELNLTGLPVGDLPELSADFSHVASLRLRGVGVSASSENFLSQFPSLRWLDISNNRLRELPPSLETMNGLTRLYLRANRISLIPRDTEILGKLTELKVLDLDQNPLARLPDFSTLPNLEALGLKGTGIDTWPTGLRDQPLEQLDLRDNQLLDVPDSLIDPPTEAVHATARINGVTFIQGNPMSEATADRLRDYWQNLRQTHPEWAALRQPGAFELQMTLQALSPSNVEPWLQGLPADQLRSKKAIWQSLVGEPRSREFFELLNQLAGSYQGEENFPDLQGRVWQMLEAASESTDLRRELFEQAGAPACEDRASLSFSYLEIKLMIHNARALANEADEAATLIRLARGLFRLDQVERIALRDIQARREAISTNRNLTAVQRAEQLKRIEEVEVRLAYRVGLKDRLALPGQPNSGRFIHMAGVTGAMLDTATANILALDDSPSEFQSLVGRDFWVDYVKQTYAASFQALNEPFITRQIEVDEAKATGTLEDSAYVSQSEALDLQRRIKEAELIQSLTQDELDTLTAGTDL